MSDTVKRIFINVAKLEIRAGFLANSIEFPIKKLTIMKRIRSWLMNFAKYEANFQLTVGTYVFEKNIFV